MPVRGGGIRHDTQALGHPPGRSWRAGPPASVLEQMWRRSRDRIAAWAFQIRVEDFLRFDDTLRFPPFPPIHSWRESPPLVSFLPYDGKVRAIPGVEGRFVAPEFVLQEARTLMAALLYMNNKVRLNLHERQQA